MEIMEEETMQKGMLMRIRIFKEEKKKKNKTTKRQLRAKQTARTIRPTTMQTRRSDEFGNQL